MSSSGCKLAGADTVHAFIYVRRVGFVKCHEWRVACNRLTLACSRIIAAAIAFEVALQVASVAHSVFMTSQYRRLSALSVLSRYCWVNTCQLPPVIRYETILMLFRSTSPLGDHASPPPVHLSVSDLPPPSSPCFTAELNGPCVLRRIHTLRRRFSTEPEPIGSGPNQGSGRFGYYIGYLTTRVRVVNSGPGNRVPVNIPRRNSSSSPVELRRRAIRRDDAVGAMIQQPPSATWHWWWWW